MSAPTVLKTTVKSLEVQLLEVERDNVATHGCGIVRLMTNPVFSDTGFCFLDADHSWIADSAAAKQGVHLSLEPIFAS